MLSLSILLFLVSTIDRTTFLETRLWVAGVPVNLIEVTLLLAWLSLLLVPSWQRSRLGVLLARDFRMPLLCLMMLFVYGAVLGYSNGNDPYEISRDFRPILLLILSYLFTLIVVRSPELWSAATAVILAGGSVGIIRTFLSVVPVLSSSSDYVSARSDTVSSGVEFVQIFVFAALATGYRIFRSKFVSWSLLLLAVGGALISFSLTAYGMLILVPLLTVTVRSARLERRVLIIGVLCAVTFLLLVGVLLIPADQEGPLGLFVRETTEQLLHPEESAHYKIRGYGWEGTLDALEGVTLVAGKGLGTRHFIDTEYEGDEQAILVEATYATCVLYLGAVGVIALAWLHLKFVLVALQIAQEDLTSYQKTMVLTILVYGLTTIINACLHNNFNSPPTLVIYGSLMALLTLMKNSFFKGAPTLHRSAPYPTRILPEGAAC